MAINADLKLETFLSWIFRIRITLKARKIRFLCFPSQTFNVLLTGKYHPVF